MVDSGSQCMIPLKEISFIIDSETHVIYHHIRESEIPAGINLLISSLEITTATHLIDLMGKDSPIVSWAIEELSLQRGITNWSAGNCINIGGHDICLSLRSLKQGSEPCLFYLRVTDSNLTLTEGSAVVTRKHWHDIKNQLGGIKLYSTFLRKKMPEGDDREIIDKILVIMNDLIDLIDRIRAGEGK